MCLDAFSHQVQNKYVQLAVRIIKNDLITIDHSLISKVITFFQVKKGGALLSSSASQLDYSIAGRPERARDISLNR